jgi:hypothetical protein
MNYSTALSLAVPVLMLVATVNLVAYWARNAKKEADARLRAHYDAHPEKADARALMRAAGYNV